VLVAILFSITAAVLGMFVSAVANSLSKIALDALIQRDVDETLRSSAFARSETFLQLAWVAGAAIGVALPSHRSDGGAIGFWIAAVLVGAVAALVVLRHRTASATTNRATAVRAWPEPPGSVGPRTPDPS
jgi:drug/metabolite transporter (DMT)-like permease